MLATYTVYIANDLRSVLIIDACFPHVIDKDWVIKRD